MIHTEAPGNPNREIHSFRVVKEVNQATSLAEQQPGKPL